MSSFTCAGCEQEFEGLSAEMLENRYGEYFYFCAECAGKFSICYECGEPNKEVFEIDDIVMCRNCRSEYCIRCSDCGTWVYSETSYCVGDNRLVCAECFEDYYYCEGCGEYVPEDHVCPYVSIHNYNAKFWDIFPNFAAANNGPLFGMEFELEVNSEYKDEAAVDFCDLFKVPCFAKEDGSLGSGGIEINFAPLSFQEVEEKLLSVFESESMNEWVSDYSATSWDNGRCGIHIHVSRDQLDESDITLIQSIIFSEYNYEYIRRLSGRDSGYGYIRSGRPTTYFGEFANTYGDVSQEFVQKYLDKFSRVLCTWLSPTAIHDRYEGVNLIPRNTIEFRLFRGTFYTKRVRAYFQFLRTLIEYVKGFSGFGRSIGEYADAFEIAKIENIRDKANQLGFSEVTDFISE